MLVEALIVEAAFRTGFDDRVVGQFGIVIAAHAEEDLAATKLRLGVPRALRILPDQLIEDDERLLRLRLRFVRARQLIHDGIVARIVGMSFQQAFVKLNRFFQLQAFDPGVHARGARGFIDLDLQIAEPAHRFGAHLLVLRLQLQEAPVLLDRLLRLHVARRIGRHLDLFALEILDGAHRLLVFVCSRCSTCAEHAGTGQNCDQNMAGNVAGAHWAPPLLVLAPPPLDARS